MNTEQRTIRYSTLLRDYGPIVPAKAIGGMIDAAKSQRRLISVPKLRGERSKAPGVARVGEYSESLLCRLVTARPIPSEIGTVEGLRDNTDALAVIEWALKLEGK